MATQGKRGGKNKKDNTKDPLNKWTDSPDEIKRKITDPVVAASIEVNKLQSALNQPGLSRIDRLAVMKALSDAKNTLREARNTSTVMKRDLAGSQRFQKDLLLKLGSLRSYLSDKQNNIPPEMKSKLQTLESRLNTMLIGTAQMKSMTEEELAGVMKRLDRLQKTTDKLPDELKYEFKHHTEILEAIASRQEAVDQHLQQVKDDLKSLGKRVGSWAMRKGMAFADRVGVGPLTAGNAIRAGKATYKGAEAVWNAGAYVNRTVKAIALSRANKAMPIEGGRGSAEEEILATFKDHVASAKRFQRRMLVEAAKTKVTDAASMIRNLMGTLLPGGIAGLLRTAGITGAAAAGAAAVGAGARSAAGAAAGAATNPMTALALGGAAASIFSAGMARTETAKAAFSQKNDPNGMLSAMSGDMGLGTAISNAGTEGGASLFDSKEWVNSSKKIKDLFSGKGNWFGERTSDASAMPIVQGFNAAKDTATSYASSAADATKSLVNKGSMLVSDWLGKTFSAGGGVDVKGLNPQMQQNMTAMAAEYYQMTGKKLPLNSGYRSNEKQAHLFKTMPKGMAAAPGSSLHNYGLAFDTNSNVGNDLDRLGLLKKYGFERPIAKEKWHIQPAGMSVSAAKSGLYSADAPANQQMGSAKATPVPQTVSSPQPRMTPQQAEAAANGGGAGGKGGGAVAATGRSGVSDIPTFETDGGMFLALNMGMIA